MLTRHPVLSDLGFIVKTGPLKEAVEEFTRLVQSGQLSMVCYAYPRQGKSTVARHLRNQLTASGKMVVLWAVIERDVKERDERGRIWFDLYRGQDRQLTVQVGNIYDALFNRTCSEADRLGTDIVLIEIDEAQNLTIEKLAALKKFVDELREHELSPFVLMMAQPEILARPEALKKKLLHDLVDRFFTEMFRLRGVRPEELEAILEYYDTTEWPVGSGISYTCHFLMEDWKRGWRLKTQAGAVREEFRKLTAQVGRGNDEVGMKYVVAAIRGFLVAAKANTDPQVSLDNLLVNAIRRCGLLQAYAVVGDAETDARRHRPSKSKGVPA